MVSKYKTQGALILFTICVNPYPVKLNNLNFQPLEVVCRYRDPQLQAAENYSYIAFVQFDTKHLQILVFKD